ncbi:MULTISPECIES: M28 family peptidase [Halolamina]|uniref:Peptidase family M28 n=1 Tax=Halolamina pelagica TaxID=699431 RepID=A0A1I5NVG2_9EURY|nr:MULTISPECIES: M28 family peptidase [Halolamina]NHX36476.1 M28 family peptidase [Halolamina sp. R1-12]SFP25231.1 Peptidase family M28 [Halolamina pelagica]
MLDPIDRETETRLGDRVDPDELERHVDAFDGTERISGTDDEWEASEYVVETLREYGCEAELHEFEGYISVPEDARVDVTAPTRETFDEAITASFGASTPPGGVSGEVVRVDEVTEGAVTAADLEGKIAFTTGLPTPEPIQLLEAAGAGAVIYQSVTPDQLHEMIVTPIWGTPGLDDAGGIPELAVAQVTHDAGDWLRDRCEEGPVEATVTTEVTTELTTLPCPVGRIEGTESDRYMVVGNHVDSWYEGITDNATAMAATLELARVFAADPPARGLVFGFWPAHSTGRYAGSAWWADREWLDLRENGVAYCHLDLNGLDGADGLWHQEMAELGEEHADVLAAAGDLPLLEGGGDGGFLGSGRPARNSDQSFWGAGLTSLLSGARLEPGEEGGPVGGGWWWHTPEDTRDKVDVDLLAEETRIAVALASRICDSPALPHDFRATVADVREQVAGIEAEADREFTGVHDDLDALADALAAAYSVIDDIDAVGSGTAAAAEDLQVALGNELVPALYNSVRDYDQEPALPHEPLPKLRRAAGVDGTRREERFAATTLTREVTRLRHRLRNAQEAAEAFVERQ